ncbi:MAG: DinB family protein [Thermomicrobiales bacterium]
MDLLDQLLEHDQWATTTLLEQLGVLTEAQLDQPFDIGHRTIRATLAHQIAVLQFWLGFMTGQPAPPRPGPAALEHQIVEHARLYAAFAQVARRLRDEGRLDETFPDPAGYPMTFGGGILMLVFHHEGHRAEVLHMLSRLNDPALATLELDPGLWDFKRRGISGDD